MPGVHPLRQPDVVRAVQEAASRHRGRPWIATGFTDRDDRASHPCGILHGEPFGVFVKLGQGPDAPAQFAAELAGLARLASAGVRTPTPVAEGVVAVPQGTALLLEALRERPPQRRDAGDWRAIGRALATAHQMRGARFGADGPGWFGPMRLDNRPTAGSSWSDFYRDRRLLPLLRSAVDSGTLPTGVATAVERLAGRLPALAGPEPVPSLLHGDAQHHNFVTTHAGPVAIDGCAYFGHPEVDLALVDYFEPAPAALFEGYQELAPIDPEFGRRKELWRLHGYLAVIAVDGHNDFGRRYLARLRAAIAALSAGRS